MKRTSLVLNDAVLADVRGMAEADGVSLRAEIELLLREGMRVIHRERGAKRYRFRPVMVDGEGGPAVDVADRRRLHDFMEGRQS